MDSAEDVGLDTPLKVSCKQEVESLCPDVGYGGGAKFACLQSKRNQLGHMCQTELFRREVRPCANSSNCEQPDLINQTLKILEGNLVWCLRVRAVPHLHSSAVDFWVREGLCPSVGVCR